jgi:hypothetical protein
MKAARNINFCGSNNCGSRGLLQCSVHEFSHVSLRQLLCLSPFLPQNRKNTPDKLEMMKYNKFLRRRTLHKEIK